MKRILLFVVLGFAVVQFANAQVIELIGKGVTGVTPSTLIIPDHGSVEKVVVVAAALFYGVDPADPKAVTFSDADETYTVNYIKADPTIIPLFLTHPQYAFGYYTATFNTADVGGITLTNFGQEKYISSFTAYIYRSGDTPGIFSSVKGPHACMMRNGKDAPVTYSVTIPSSISPRDVVVTLPFTHLYDVGGMPANYKVTAGDKVVEAELWTNNRGDHLRLETITLEDVAGDVTEVIVSLFSQKKGDYDPDKSGANFITGPGLVTTTFEIEKPPIQDQGCTLSQGYWKTHSKYGPAMYDAKWANLPQGEDTWFFLSGQSYYNVLWTPPKGGNSYYILAHQYIAASLNILAGASDAAVFTEMAAAKVLFETYTPNQVLAMKGNSAVRKSFTSLAGTLDKYNNGEIGPGHCGDNEFELKSAQINSGNDMLIREFSVYPNPVYSNATVSFTPAFDDIATVDLYNSLGQRISRLMHQSVAKDIPVNLTFDARQFNEGLYILMIQNGPGRESVKIQISR